jgi:putative toxin-antitoxin system antitoxin component (TIGR02293 family)
MEPYTNVAEVLGLRRPKDPLQFVDMVEQGFPLKALDRLCGMFAPADVTFKYNIVAKATLARYAAHSARLSAVQSAKTARLAAVWSHALSIWHSEQETRDFLLRPHQLLKGRRPVDVALENEQGGQLVHDILGRLQYGSAV